MSSDADKRRAVIETALAMSRERLSPGCSGNVSARHRKGMLITPTGIPYEQLEQDDIVYLGAAGKPAKNGRKPSSEWPFHRAIYNARSDIHAVVHCHSRFATVLACARRNIPAFHYMVAAAGGVEIPLAPYATFGSQKLSRHAAVALAAHNACLLANHGQIALGETPAKALDLAREVEELSAQYVEVLKIGEAYILPDDEMKRVLKKFQNYGQQDS